jgi:hypothetical protein
MSEYRLYRLDGADKIVGLPIDSDAANDDEACKQARTLGHSYEVEIWCGAKMVCRVPPAA